MCIRDRFKGHSICISNSVIILCRLALPLSTLVRRQMVPYSPLLLDRPSHQSAVDCCTINMTASLLVCSNKEQRAVVRFLCSENVSKGEIHRRLSKQYGNNVLPQRSVYEWTKKFKKGRTSIEHEERSGCLTSCTTDTIIEEVTISKVAYHLQISYSICMALHIKLSTTGLDFVKFVQMGPVTAHGRAQAESCRHVSTLTGLLW